MQTIRMCHYYFDVTIFKVLLFLVQASKIYLSANFMKYPLIKTDLNKSKFLYSVTLFVLLSLNCMSNEEANKSICITVSSTS